MSLVSPHKTSSDRACIGKAVEPCNVTDDNPSDCYESMHAFKKIRTSTSGLRKSPNKWTKEENQKLAALVSSYGEKKWKRISAEMGGQKTGAQCAQHWKRVLSPEIRKGHWDENEEDLLLRLVVQYGSCWKKIAKKIPQRTDIQCRYQYLKAKQSREVSWDAKEDESLIKKVMEIANCNFFQMHDINISNTSDTSNTCTSTSPSLRSSSNFNTSTTGSSVSSSISFTTDISNKENEGGLSSSCGSDIKEDDRMKCSGEFGKDMWNEKHNINMSDSPTDPGTSSWRSKETSFNGSCANCHRPFGSHINKVVWLEISEHMARLKLTSTLRTALECKTRISELLGNKFSFPASNFSPSNNISESGKHFDLKHSGGHGDPGMGGFSTQNGGSGEHRDRNAYHSSSNDNIDIKINNKSNGMPIGACASNNINLMNCNNNNITINITNSYTTSNSQTGIVFPQIAHHASAHTPSPNPSPLKTEHIPAHLLPKTPMPPILSPAPPFPSFSHLSPTFHAHLPQPNPSMKPASLRGGSGGAQNVLPNVNGLESLAAVASILPREMLDYAQF